MADATSVRWSWHVGDAFGIAIRVHVTLLVLLVWMAIAAPIAGHGVVQALTQWFLVLAVFACVMIHELGHALVARRFGCRTREILLLPIGGIAQMERLPERPAQELLVALVGPATNLAIAGVLGATIAAAGWPFDPEQPHLAGSLLVPLFWSNVALAGFNLLPAFPMDGGRVLRAALAIRLGRRRATRIAGSVGKLLAGVFVIGGLSRGAPILALIGVFVWFAAQQESAIVALTAAFGGATAADAMIRSAHVVPADAVVDEAAAQMVAEGRHELAVVENGRVAGVVTAADLVRWLDAPPPHAAVGTAMQRDVPIVEPLAPLADVLEPLRRRGIVFVGDRDAVIGVLTSEQLATYASLHPQA